jgi:hypothetical protein
MPVLDFLKKHGVLLLAGVYFLGYLITSMHFASYGVVSFELLRIRYLATGLLFIFYLALIVLPAFLLMRNINRDKKKHGRTWAAAGVAVYSATGLVTVYLSIQVLSNVSGLSAMATPVAANWNKLGEHLPRNLQWAALATGGILLFAVAMILVLLGVVAIWRVANRKRPILEKSDVELKWTSLLISLPVAYILIFLLFEAFEVLSLLIDTRSFAATTASPKLSVVSLSEGWRRLFFAAAGFYCLFVVLVAVPRLAGSSDADEQQAYGPVYRSYVQAGLLYWIATIVMVVFGAYVVGVYPYLPQQIGGGKPVPVVVQLEDGRKPWDSADRLLLLDSSQERWIVVATKGTETKVFAIPPSQLIHVEFLFPWSSAGAK